MIAEPPDLDRKDKRTDGFTLLEVLIALIIFALAFGALAGLYQTSLRQTGTADELRRATLLAETQLARFGHDLPLEPGRIGGTSSDGSLRWEADISLAKPLDEGSEMALFRIRVAAGLETGSAGLVSLTTLRVGNR